MKLQGWLAGLGMAVGALAPASASAAGAPAPAWETLRVDDGIAVARRVVPGSPFVAFRGEGDVAAPLARVGSVLVDIDRGHEWIDSVVEARILRQLGAREYVTYSHVATPVGMTDRDFVMDVTVDVDAARKGLVVRMRSVDDPLAPKTSYVRGEIQESTFTLTPSDDGKTTHVVAEIHCDPKGSVAGWMVNWFQRNWGWKTIHALRSQVAKSDVAPKPALEALLAGTP